MKKIIGIVIILVALVVIFIAANKPVVVSDTATSTAATSTK